MRTRRPARLAHAAVTCALLTAAAAAGEPVAFVSGIEDLPLMPGLVEVAEAGLVFDAPGGRIVEAYASGAVDRDAVLRFYAETLPQLGWQRLGAARFRREGETLDVEFSGAAGAAPLTVRFALSPTAAGEQ